MNRYSADLTTECLSVRAAGGGPEYKIDCSSSFPSVVARPDADGRLVVGFSTGDNAEMTRVVVDPGTGAIVDRTQESVEDAPAATTTASIEHAGAVLGVENDGKGSARVIVSQTGSAQTVFEVSGPSDYFFSFAFWSPDGAWIVVVDGLGQNLLVAARGDRPPRTLVDAKAGVIEWVSAPRS
jgi:hypothetical protein